MRNRFCRTLAKNDPETCRFYKALAKMRRESPLDRLAEGKRKKGRETHGLPSERKMDNRGGPMKKRLNKGDVCREISKAKGIKATKVNQVINHLSHIIERELKAGGGVCIRGLFKIHLHHYRERRYYPPFVENDRVVKIEARLKPKITLSKAFRQKQWGNA